MKIEYAQYGNGRVAVILNCDDGEPFAKLSVNMSDDSDVRESEFAMKDYSENERIAAKVKRLGLFEDTGRTVSNGFVRVPVYRIPSPPPTEFKG